MQQHLSSYYDKDRTKLLITNGLYFFHMQRWMNFLNQGNLMIIDGERLVRDPGPIIEEVQEFLGLPKLLWKEDFAINPHTGFYCYQKVTEEDWVQNLSKHTDIFDTLQCLSSTKGRTRKKLHEQPGKFTLDKLKQFYKPYNEKFFELIGIKFDWNY